MHKHFSQEINGKRPPGRSWHIWDKDLKNAEFVVWINSAQLRVIFLTLVIMVFFFNFLGWGETESTWHVGHYWPNVPAPDDRWWWLWNIWWNEDWQRKPKYSKKTCPSATLSTTNHTWRDLGSDQGSRGGKPANNCLSYGAAITVINIRFAWMSGN
jgi:hypothetical protein